MGTPRSLVVVHGTIRLIQNGSEMVGVEEGKEKGGITSRYMAWHPPGLHHHRVTKCKFESLSPPPPKLRLTDCQMAPQI